MTDTGPQRAREPEPPESHDAEPPLLTPVPPRTPLQAGSVFGPPQNEDLSHEPASFSIPEGRKVPADLRTPLGWWDLVLLGVFYLVCGALLYLLVSTGAFLAFGVSPATMEKSATARSVVLIVSQGLLSGATLLFLFVLLRGRSGAPFWPAMGWRHFRDSVSSAGTAAQYAFSGFGLALLVGFISRYVGQGADLPMDEMFHSRASVLMMMALGILVAPLVEETIFRGCIYPVIARRFGLTAGVLATGILFGLAHAQQLWGGWGQIALLVGVGIVLTYVRAQAGTVAASYFIHLGYNTTLFVGFYFATSGLRYIPS